MKEEIIKYLTKYQGSVRRAIINFVRSCEHHDFDNEDVSDYGSSQKVIELGNIKEKLLVDWNVGTRHCGISVYLLDGDTAYYITGDEGWSVEYLAECPEKRKEAAEYDVENIFDALVGRLALGRLEKGQKVYCSYGKWHGLDYDSWCPAE